MLKKRLGIEAIEGNYSGSTTDYYKIPSILIIPSDCWCIGHRAFHHCLGLKKVVISESVMEIGDMAFENCWNATIILKKPMRELKFLGSWAFDHCIDVKYVKEEVRG